MAKKKKKKGMFSKLTSKGIILTIQLIASAVFLGYIYVLKMLPTRYYAILIIFVDFYHGQNLHLVKNIFPEQSIMLYPHPFGFRL